MIRWQYGERVNVARDWFDLNRIDFWTIHFACVYLPNGFGDSTAGFCKGWRRTRDIKSESNGGARLRALIATPAIGGTHPSSFPAECHYSRDRKSRVRNQAVPYARHSRHVNRNSHGRRTRGRPSIFNWILIGRDYSRALGSIPGVRLIIQLSESIWKWR